MREVAKRSFDGGRERGKSKRLNDALRPLSLSLADARHPFSEGAEKEKTLI
jgi:hypothetical protein